MFPHILSGPYVNPMELAVYKSFKRAVDLDENINDNGTLNWDFVSADIWMDLADKGIGFGKGSVINDLIDNKIDAYEDYMVDLAY